MRLQILIRFIFIVSNLCNVCLSQSIDSIKPKKYLTVSLGISQRLPLNQKYTVKKGSRASGDFSEYTNKEFLTYGALGSFGYNFKLKGKWSLHPELSYYYYVLKTHSDNENYCNSCQIPVQFKGTIDEKMQFHTIGIQTAIQFQLSQNLDLTNGFGFNRNINQNNFSLSENSIDNSKKIMSNQTKIFYNNFHSYHELGLNSYNSRFQFQIGFYIIYSQSISKAFNPYLSIQLNLF